MGNLRKIGYLVVAMIVFFFCLGAVDFWIFKFSQGPEALFNYWIAVGLAFISFGCCLAVIMYVSNPTISANVLVGIFLTPFILLVAGIWDWIIYFIYMRYDAPYPDYSVWSAQYRWAKPYGIEWTTELQILWTIAFLVLLMVMWIKILGKNIKWK